MAEIEQSIFANHILTEKKTHQEKCVPALEHTSLDVFLKIVCWMHGEM